MVVLALFQESYVVIPLFSYHGPGLENKDKLEEDISVQDHRHKYLSQQQSMHPPLITEILNPDIQPYHPKTVAHVTYPASRKYTLPVIQEGILEQQSMTCLADLYLRHFSLVMKPTQQNDPPKRQDFLLWVPLALPSQRLMLRKFSSILPNNTLLCTKGGLNSEIAGSWGIEAGHDFSKNRELDILTLQAAPPGT